MCRLEERMNSVMGDIRDLAHLQQVFEETQLEIVIHMVAQPLVRESYKNPVYTYETNVMGTVHVLEPLVVYLMIVEKQYKDKSFAGNYNVGPNETECMKRQIEDFY